MERTRSHVSRYLDSTRTSKWHMSHDSSLVNHFGDRKTTAEVPTATTMIIDHHIIATAATKSSTNKATVNLPIQYLIIRIMLEKSLSKRR